jgi:hypothetical protein
MRPIYIFAKQKDMEFWKAFYTFIE